VRTSDPLLQKCRHALERLYGSRLEGVVLFGSCARGEEEAESDVDLLVLLRGQFDLFGEIQKIVDALYAIGLDSGRCISAQPVPFEDYRDGRLQLYRNAAREGILI